jgi:hypothetical protein
MKKTNNTRYLLAALLLVSLSAFFFVNSQGASLSGPSVSGSPREISMADRNKSEDRQDAARIPGLFTLARLLELAGQFLNRGL